MHGLEIAAAIFGIIGAVVGVVVALTCFHAPTKRLFSYLCCFTGPRPLPLAANSSIPLGKAIHEIISRKVFEDGLMETLKREDVDKIGVWGAGGVGKTTVAQRILNRGLTEGFDEIVMVTVGQLVEDMLIQKGIAEMLGLELRDETLIPRAHALRGRLEQESSTTLILLDDVWQELNLEQLGIPCHPKWCTVIITSRDRDVLTSMMSVENVVELGVLHDDEAWDFFRTMIGTGADGGPTAYEVMKECKGLLVALEIVGQAHKDETRQDVWAHSLQQLRKSNPEDIPNVLEKVFKPLKLSYERLENENAKSTFLLCGLFAEDADIPLEHLTHFAMGLRLFRDIGELKEVRGRIRRMTDMLRNRRMLLDGSSEDHVRMHDVVRDVSIYIARKKRLVNCNDCAWNSSFVQQGVIPVPGLKLLFLNGKVEREMDINNNDLIRGSTELNVLRIEHGSLTTLPLPLPLPLRNSLTTLVLRDCASLESIAVVGQLVNLEILVCHSCGSMNMLPEQVTGLKRLKLLEISECRNLIRVAEGVISSLVALEELKMVGSFGNWQGSAGGNNATAAYARLREIESLTKLRLLHIQVHDIELAAQPLRLPLELVQFRVHFGRGTYPASSKRSSHFRTGIHPMSPEKSYQREMFLLDDGDKRSITNYGDSSSAANTFLTSTEWVSAAGANKQAAFTLNLATAPDIRGLSLYGFGNKKHITSTAAAATAIPLLEFLSLEDLHNLEEIWSDASIPSNSFNRLKRLKLSKLPALKQMGKSAISATDGFFVQLEIVLIEDCEKMEHLLYLEPNGDKITLVFPKLKRLNLLELPKLMSICSSRRIDSIQFPLLEDMVISSCQNLKWLIDDGHCQDEDSSHLFCHREVTFGNLKSLFLDNTTRKNVWCPNVQHGFFGGLVRLQLIENKKIKSFSSSRIARNLVNLKNLEVFFCTEMVKVIEDGDVSSLDNNAAPLFPSLQSLFLCNLPKLESFCEWRRALKLPSLNYLWIEKCRKMKCFNSAGSLIAPALTKGSLNGHEVQTGVDVNAALRKRFESA